MKRVHAALLLGVVVSVLLGCDLVELSPLPGTQNPPVPGKGSLVLTIGQAPAGARTLAPPIVMEIASFDIHGIGPDPDSDTFDELGNTSGVLALNDLSPGAWTISVEALNPYVEGDPNRGGDVIGYGETEVTITEGTVTPANILITPLSGSGTLSLTVDWTEVALRRPQFEATLTPSGGSPIDLPFTLSPRPNPVKAEYSNADFPAGYYLLILQLRDRGSPVWGIAEAVRIVQDQTTSHTYTLTQ